MWNNLKQQKEAIVVVGLGYVGLPLAHAFAKEFKVYGYDCNPKKIALLKKGIEPTGEVPKGGLKEVDIEFSSDPATLELVAKVYGSIIKAGIHKAFRNEEYGNHLQKSIVRSGKSQPGIRLGAP